MGMRKSVFKQIYTVDDARNRIGLAMSVADEHNLRKEDCLKIEDSCLNDTRYIASSSTNKGFIHMNYFSYKAKDSSLVGLARSLCGSDEIVPMSDTKYVQFTQISESVWVGTERTGMFEVIMGKRTLNKEFVDTDVLNLGYSLRFLQLDTFDTRSLICISAVSSNEELFTPVDMEDFERWFMQKITKLGYEGQLDCCVVSEVFRLMYEVENTIFSTTTYEQLDLNDYREVDMASVLVTPNIEDVKDF